MTLNNEILHYITSFLIIFYILRFLSQITDSPSKRVKYDINRHFKVFFNIFNFFGKILLYFQRI